MKKIAFVFSGQGAQKVGMAKDFFDSSINVKKMFKIADSIRQNTSKQCFCGTQEELNQTINTQPCLFCANAAASIVATENNIIPNFVAGFSLGELNAICYSKILTFEETFKLVCKRAQAMHEAEINNKGTMLAILKTNNDDIKKICKKFSCAYPANYNCPGQIVVSIKESLVSDFSNEIKTIGGIVIKLPVSGAFHSPFMDSASNKMKTYLSNLTFCSPNIPIYSNLTASLYDTNFIDLLSQQINHPVLWQKTIENMIKDGTDTFVELGIGTTLSKLITKIDNSKKILNIEDKESLNATIDALR